MAPVINIGPVVGGRSRSAAEFERKRRGVLGKYCGQFRLRRARPELGVVRSNEHGGLGHRTEHRGIKHDRASAEESVQRRVKTLPHPGPGARTSNFTISMP